jgi:hypothetical protein
MENELFFNFIYLFQAPDDSKLVSMFEMADLFYKSTPDLCGNIVRSPTILNEELFYDTLRGIIKTCYDDDVLLNIKLKQLTTLLINNHFIKKSL